MSDIYTDTDPMPFGEHKGVRALRDRVYGHPTSDKNWGFCGANWMKPDNVKWLKKRLKKKR